MQTKDKKYIENLFKSYKKNKARLMMLEKGLITDEDYILGAINYTKKLKLGNVQTSTKVTLDNVVEIREQEIKDLKDYISTVDILIESLTKKERFIMESIYFEKMYYIDIAYELNYKDKYTVWDNKEKILNRLSEVL